MNIVTVTRKPFEAQAVLVTHANMAEVSKWCSGRIQRTRPKNGTKPRKYIRLEVTGVTSDRLKKAFVGDWVVFSGSSFRIYLDEPFQDNFVVRSETMAKDLRTSEPKQARSKKAKKEFVDYRDAKNGKFITAEQAEANPDTTVSEARD